MHGIIKHRFSTTLVQLSVTSVMFSHGISSHFLITSQTRHWNQLNPCQYSMKTVVEEISQSDLVTSLENDYLDLLYL